MGNAPYRILHRYSQAATPPVKSNESDYSPITLAELALVPTLVQAEAPISISVVAINRLAVSKRYNPRNGNGIQIFAALLRDIEIALNPSRKPKPNLVNKLPKQYHEFLDVFSKELSNKLPLHRPYDYKIPL
ncbi:hypothetical protein GTA08_BOTSDO13114 [Botryosphaeria dothidea]|uniref:Uncharacterized protein n=1 Tax=Botryosphaeria dothidea TaxID=55169 RepID=A0A8H4J3M5_9PEZI|nr:hypothetical protein GTA08_BOTSDO13114 [Botryosphaeria dothidea]